MSRKLWWAALGGAAAGYGLFRWLRSIDRRVRLDMAAPLFPDEPRIVAGGARERKPGLVEEQRPDDGEMAVAERVLTAIRLQPGVRQAELYALFPDESRRNLQDLLLRLAREAVLTRRRDGNTYRLYEAGVGG